MSWKWFQIGHHITALGERAWQPILQQRMARIRGITWLTTAFMVWLSDQMIVGQHLQEPLRITYLVLYGLMMYFLSSNFFKMIFGFWYAQQPPSTLLWHPLNHLAEPQDQDRVAIIFPVYHEDVNRVAAGMAACQQSLRRDCPEYEAYFDFFLLSDSRKEEYKVLELASVYRLRKIFDSSNFFYRHRVVNSNAKLGNVTDFLRRFGKEYPYVLVMDADSVMEGQCIVTLWKAMIGNPHAGILQSNPKPVFRKTIFGRLQQFSAHLYGSVFSYSMQAMYMGHAIYIGHNAIIRTEAFVKYAILPHLSGKKPWGGKPLSHDIIEAVSLGRAGYDTWFLPSLSGSYEEIPANLMGFLIRERRWMIGNLQHIRFWFLRGLQGIHRETLINGVMAYFSAPLWFMFLIVSAYSVLHFVSVIHISVMGMEDLRVPALVLLFSSMVFLFLPRVIAILANLGSEKSKAYGGRRKIILSSLIETAFSFALSPIIMIYISIFFWHWLKGKTVIWGTQDRGDTELSIREAWEAFGKVSLFGMMCWCLLLYYWNNTSDIEMLLLRSLSGGWFHGYYMMIWYLPVIGGISLSFWIARWTSKTWDILRQQGIFLIPEEVEEPLVLQDVKRFEQDFYLSMPAVEDREAVRTMATTNQHFITCHAPETRSRAHIYHRYQHDPDNAKMFWYYLLEKNSFLSMVRDDSHG